MERVFIYLQVEGERGGRVEGREMNRTSSGLDVRGQERQIKRESGRERWRVRESDKGEWGTR